jgi:type II secretory pathway component GspD/PulD (secretin)
MCEAHVPRRVLPGLVFTAALMAVGPVHSADLQLPLGPYKYLVVDQDIDGVLVEFGRNVGLQVDVSDRVKGRLRGQISTATAREFLDGLCESYGLVWYFDGTTLHVNAKTEVRSELVSIGELSPDEATKQLSALGISDTRFPVRTTEGTGVLSVSGPPAFLSRVRQTFTAIGRRLREDNGGDEIRVRVFRGGYAPIPSDGPIVSPVRSRS